MRVMIRGCTNDNCFYWEEGRCDLPAEEIDHWHMIKIPTRHWFDYDHATGRLVCAMMREEGEEDEVST